MIRKIQNIAEPLLPQSLGELNYVKLFDLFFLEKYHAA